MRSWMIRTLAIITITYMHICAYSRCHGPSNQLIKEFMDAIELLHGLALIEPSSTDRAFLFPRADKSFME